ncbi:MAG: YihY family inner membrane protein [Kiritimatiellae bacterium]|jgi:membrane protein|nr:YihY family inner membrane protein [Kiritimatiellia bacterium]
MNKIDKESTVKKVIAFFQRDMWQMALADRSLFARAVVKSLQVLTLVADGFKRNQCSLHASSLTLFSLLSLVPVLVLVLALAKAFGGDEIARKQIDKQINAMVEKIEQGANQNSGVQFESTDDKDQQPEATAAFATQVRDGANKIFEQVNSINFGKLGGAGAILLLWSVIGVLGKVEASFNQIWGVDKPRPLLRKFTEYLAVIIILPFLLTAVSTVPVFQTISSVMEKTMGQRASSGIVAVLDSSLLRVVMSAIGGTITFAFLLGFMPNERVKLTPVLVGGFITMILFVVWMKVCTMLQVGIAKYSALYGGFAVLPILLIWVHTSWQIILLGSEISFAVQNRDTYMLELFADEASMRARLLMAISLCMESVKAGRQENGGAFDAEQYAHDNGVPHRFVSQILDELVEHNFLAEIADHPGKYLPCRSSTKILVSDIVCAMVDKGESIETLGLEELSASVAELNGKWHKAEEDVLSVPLAQLCEV